MALKGRNAMIIAPSPEAGGPARAARANPRGARQGRRAGGPGPGAAAPIDKDLDRAHAQAATWWSHRLQNNVRAGLRERHAGHRRRRRQRAGDRRRERRPRRRRRQDRALQIFDNATSCSSENPSCWSMRSTTRAIAALEGEGGCCFDAAEKAKVAGGDVAEGKLSRELIAQGRGRARRGSGRGERADAASLPHGGGDRRRARDTRSPARSSPWCSTIYRAPDFDEARRGRRAHPRLHGPGHSAGIHTRLHERAPGSRPSCAWSACWSTRRTLRQRRQLRQRAAVHAVHGLRHLGRRAAPGAGPAPSAPPERRSRSRTAVRRSARRPSASLRGPPPTVCRSTTGREPRPLPPTAGRAAVRRARAGPPASPPSCAGESPARTPWSSVHPSFLPSGRELCVVNL